MIKIDIVSTGKLKQSYLQAGVDDYLSRVNRYAKVTYTTVKDEPVQRQDHQANIDKAKEAEGKRLLAKCKQDSFLIALDAQGKPWTSKRFAAFIKARAQHSQRVIFIIGGTAGLSPEVLSRANLCLSLSRLTFTHQMVPIMLLEQVYRSIKIIRGEPYHW